MLKGKVSFIGAISFEERSLAWLYRMQQNGQIEADRMKLIHFGGGTDELNDNITTVKGEYDFDAVEFDRFDTKKTWDQVWDIVCDCDPTVSIDVTCLPREVLAMFLFAFSVCRDKIKKIEVLYTSAPSAQEGGYATQNQDLSEDARWLSRGIRTTRSIVGYPGDFSSEKRCHAIVLAGHEPARTLEAIEFVEPLRCSLGNESAGTSTVSEARDFSEDVVSQLRHRITLPNIEPLSFSADSIEGTLKKLEEIELFPDTENIVLIAMNTKLSFVGATMFALKERHVRMIYSVPEEYNPLYCIGVGKSTSHDITEYIKQANTIPAR